MNRPCGYGIDFGTTNSSIAIGYDDGHVELVPIDENRDLPFSLRSIEYLHRDGNRLAGEAAVEEFAVTGGQATACGQCPLVIDDIDGRFSNCNQFASGGRCLDSRLISGLKSELSNAEFRSTHSWAQDFRIEELVTIVLRDLKTRADRVVGEPVDRVVIGHPVAFVGATGENFDRKQELALRRLERSAIEAGFREIVLMPEPAAALMDEHLPIGFAMAADFGGGTFDVAVMEVGDEAAEIAALQGVRIGGEDFDGMLFDAKVGDQLGLNDELERGGRMVTVPNWVRYRIKTLSGLRYLLSDRNLAFALQYLRGQGFDIGPLDRLLHGGYGYQFYGAVEHAKVVLSEEELARIDFTRPGLVVRSGVKRQEFEELIAPSIEAIRTSILGAVSDAGITAEDVGVVLRTGGSAQIPMFVRMLEGTFPRAEVRERPAFTSVAAGLAAVATQEWGYG